MIKTHFKDTQDNNFDYSFVGIFLGLGGNFAYGQKYWGYFTQIAFLAFFPSPHVAKKVYIHSFGGKGYSVFLTSVPLIT